MRLILLLMIAAMGDAVWAADATFAPLWLYQGTWHVTRANLAAGAKPEELVNRCAQIGKYFGCQQTINGQQGNLLIFVGTGKPGQFHTQNVTPDARATGRQELEVRGDKWTFTYTWDQGGKTTYYRTTYTFSGKNKIHFEQEESSNGKDYTVTGSGDQVKAGAR
ncbi:MAG TPA: hypothetical protein VHU83_17840 [Bryobacteraceae bacterium]|nr:hypothetical protein [Bryobacteraceae bacterium]